MPTATDHIPIGSFLRTLRLARGLTEEEAATSLGLSFSRYVWLEHGHVGTFNEVACAEFRRIASLWKEEPHPEREDGQADPEVSGQMSEVR